MPGEAWESGAPEVSYESPHQDDVWKTCLARKARETHVATQSLVVMTRCSKIAIAELEVGMIDAPALSQLLTL